jgi:hypothetical protein
VELKSVERLLLVHEAKVITYFEAQWALGGLCLGLLIDFRAAAIRRGLRRLTNHKILPGSACDPVTANTYALHEVGSEVRSLPTNNARCQMSEDRSANPATCSFLV